MLKVVGVFIVTYIVCCRDLHYMQPQPYLHLSGRSHDGSRDLRYVNKQHRSADCSVTRPTVQYNRQQLLALRKTTRTTVSSELFDSLRRLQLLRRRRGNRGGAGRRTYLRNIPVINRQRTISRQGHREQRSSVLVRPAVVRYCKEQRHQRVHGGSEDRNTTTAVRRHCNVLNASAITKPHAVEHLASDLSGYMLLILLSLLRHTLKGSM